MEFSKKMEGTNLNDVACCPNGYKLVVGNNHINLREILKYNYQCDADNEYTGGRYTKYTGGGYTVYRSRSESFNGWRLHNGDITRLEYKGGEDCCPRDGKMIIFEVASCKEVNLEILECFSKLPGFKAEIQCA